MSVSYIYNDLVISVPKDMLDEGEGGPLSGYNDLILLSGASGVTDSSQCSATYSWVWLNNASYRDTSILHLLSGSSALTVGGDYSGTSNKYNLKIASTNDPYETAAVRADGDLRLVLVAQTGAYGSLNDSSITVKDEHIAIRAQAKVTRDPVNPGNPDYDPEADHDPAYKDSTASDNQSTALALSVAGTLTVSSDLLGTIESSMTSKLWGIRVIGSDGTVSPVNTSVSQNCDAIGIRAADLLLLRNFTASITAANTGSAAGFASPTISGSTFYAAGIKVSGDITAEDGVWGGAISATVSNSKYFADVDHVGVDKEGKKLSAASASITGNDFSAYGIRAGGTIDIRHLGGGSGTEIQAKSSNNTVTLAATGGDSDASVSFSNNDFSAYGIKAEDAVFDQTDSTFDIKATISNNAVSAKFLSGKSRTASFGSVTMAAVGIDVGTLTVDSFNAKISAEISKITVSADNWSVLSDGIKYSAAGINTSSITASDNLGGTITVKCSNITGLGNDVSSSSLTVSGIYNSSIFRVTGRVNSAITVTMSGNTKIGSNPTAFGIYTSTLVADAFSGSISVSAPLASYEGGDAVKSVGIAAGLMSTATVVSGRTLDAFDINGSIYSTIAGVVTVSEMNLRVSGSINAPGITVMGTTVQEGIAIASDGRSGSGTNNDRLELASTAVITGQVNLYGGENTVIINSGAKVNGKLLAERGLMNIRFDLDETVNSGAIVTTDLDDISLASTSTISINLNNSKDGATYTLFKYSDSEAATYWTNGLKQVTFSYQGQSVVVNVSSAGKAEASFTDAAGNVVSAELTYSGKSVTVKVANACELEAFGGECTTALDADARTATLAWADAVGAENYEVEYSVDGGKTIVVMVDGSRKSTVVNGIDPESTITWRVRGNTGDGSEVSAWSEWSSDSYTDPAPGAPVMASGTPRAVNPDDEGGGVTASRARFTWEAATGDAEIAGYTVECISSMDVLTAEEIAAIFADPASISGDENKKYFKKYTTAPEVVATSLTNQSYVYWRVKATDVNGLDSEYKDGEAFRIWVGDSVKPVWRALDDDETDAATAAVTYDRSDAYNVKLGVDFSWISAVDTQSGVKSYLVQYKLSSDSWSNENKVYSITVMDDGSKNYSASLSDLAGGLYDYRIKAVDYVGNESSYLVNSQFGASDLTPPKGSFGAFATPRVIGDWTSPNSGSTSSESSEEGGSSESSSSSSSSSSGSATLTGVSVYLGWSDNFTDESDIIYTVEVSDNADFLGKKTYSFTTTSKSLTLDNSLGNAVSVLAGMSKVYYRVSVADSQGNVNPLSSAVQSFDMVDSVTGDAISFSGTVSAPTNLSSSKSKVEVGSTYRTDLTFRWSSGDNSFGVYDYTLYVTTGGKTTQYSGITATSYTLKNQLDGKYSWKVVANSGSGSTASASGTEFVVDATAPVFSGAARSSVALKDFTINWDAATDASGIQGYILQYGAGAYSASTWMTTTVTTTSYKGSISSDGTYNYRIYAVDKYNNTSSDFLSGSFNISSESHGSGSDAEVLTVTGIDDAPAFSSGVVGLSISESWMSFDIVDDGADVYIIVSDVASQYNSGSGITVNGYSGDDLNKAIFTKTISSGELDTQLHFDKAGTYYLQVKPKKSNSIMSFSVAVASDVPTAGELSGEDNAWNGYDAAAGKKISANGYDGIYRIAVVDDAGAVSQTLLEDYVGKADPVDYRRFDIATAGSYEFELEGIASPLDFTVYGVELDSLGNVSSLKKIKGLTLSPKYDGKKKAWVDDASTGALLLNAGSYYFSVTAKNAAKDQNSVYGVTVTGEAFVKANTADDNWAALPAVYADYEIAAGTASPDIALFADEWVGFGDTVDYRKLTVNQTGSYDFTLTGVENPVTLTISTLNSKGKLDKVKSISVDGNKKTSGAISELLVLAGTEYYIGVTANDAKKGKNSAYEVTVTGNGFVAANNTDDDWTALPAVYADYAIAKGEASPSIALFEDEWVGYGDTIDYRRITIDQSGSYDFTIYGVKNSVTMTIWSLNAAKGKLDKVKSITVDGNKKTEGEIGNLLVLEGTEYYVSVAPNNAKSGKNTYYGVAVTGTGFVKGRNADDDWTALAGDEFVKTIAKGTAAPEVALCADEWVGFGDTVDYRKLTVNQTGSYDFTLSGVENSVTMTIYTVNAAKGTLDKKKSVTVDGSKKTSGAISGLIVDEGTELYVGVTANNAKKGKNSAYEVTVTGTGFVKANQQVDDTWEEAAAGTTETTKFVVAYSATGAVSNTSVSTGEWVGYGDIVDFREITVGVAGKYNLNVGNVTNNAKLTLYSLVESKGEYKTKSIKSITVNAAKTDIGEITGLLLDKGVYYVSVEASNWKAAKNTSYDLSFTGTGFVKGRNTDDDWTALEGDEFVKTIAKGTAAPEVALCTDEWVGFGDTVDYRKLTVNQTGSYDFTLTGVENSVTMTIYTVNAAKGTLDKKKSVTVDGSKASSGTIGGFIVDEGTVLYVGVTANNAKNGKNSAYEVAVTGTGFVEANNADDDWTALPGEYTISGSTSFSDWVGYNDAIDYRSIETAVNGGIYTFDVSGVTNNVKLTVYSVKNGKLSSVKSVTATDKTGTAGTGELCLAAGTQYFVAVEAVNWRSAKNSAYAFAMVEKGTFNHLDNNTWDEATAASGDTFGFDGVLTKSAGGDAVDYIAVSDYDSLALDANSGKIKISFYDENRKSVKASQVTFANASTKNNLANVTLVANDAVTDNISLADLDDAIKYLKIEAATNGMDSYKLQLAKLA